MTRDVLERLAEEVGWTAHSEWLEEGPVSPNVVRGRLGLPPISRYDHMKRLEPAEPDEQVGCLRALLIAAGIGYAARRWLV